MGPISWGTMVLGANEYFSPILYKENYLFCKIFIQYAIFHPYYATFHNERLKKTVA
jgi:hypothetical protein